MSRVSSLAFAAGLGISLAAVSHAARITSPSDAPRIEVLDVAREQAPNGQVFNVTKQLVNGEPRTIYQAGAVVMTDPEFRAWLTSNPAPKVDVALARVVAAAQPGELVPVAIRLADNPSPQLRADIVAKHAPQLAKLDRLRAQLAELDQPGVIIDELIRAAFVAEVGANVPPGKEPLRAMRTALAIEHERVHGVMRAELVSALRPRVDQSHRDLADLITNLGGTVRGFTLLSSGASAFVPPAAVDRLAADPRIASILLNAPGTKELNNQGVSLGLTTGFWANSILGDPWDAAQLDSGVQQDHPTFGAVTGVAAVSFLNGPGRGATDSDGHGTAVASIMAGRNATNRGMAYGLETLLNAAWDDVAVSIDWAFTAVQDPEVINGSFGIPANAPTVADYTATETYIDREIRENNALYTKSAGNLGPNAETITQPAGIYNGLVVANMNDTEDTNRANDVINASSSRGPTINSRKKPDITAPGTPTTAANNGWAGAGDDWISFGGTSSAAPHVAGGVILLTDARSNDEPTAIKAILINTANGWDDAGTLNTNTDDGPVASELWNQTYGWGYLNLGAAYTNRNNVISSSVAGTPAFRLYQGNITANSRATLVWNRHVQNVAGVETARPLTDLDLLMYTQSTGASVGSSLDVNDNVEVVFSAAAQPVVLKVDAWSTVDANIGVTQPYSLAHTGGFTEVALPVLSSIATPTTVSPGEAFTFNIIVSNTSADLPVHSVVVTLNALPAGWTTSSSLSVNVGTLQPSGDSQSVQFVVTPPCNLAGTSADFTWTHAHTSYGESVTTNRSASMTVAPITALTFNTPTAVTAPRTFSFASPAGEWVAVAGAEVASRDIDIRGDNDACITSPWHTSNFLDVLDFVLINGHVNGASTQYAHIFEKGGNATSTTIECDDAFDMGTLLTMTFDADEPIEPAERPFNAGKLYRIQARVTSGFFNPGVFVYRPTQTFAERSTADLVRNNSSIGPGTREVANFRALETGVHGFVVTNENAASGTVEFIARCAADHNATNTLTTQDIFDFLTSWFAADLVTADFNLDGALSVQDIFDFLAEWFLGC
jgi:serine protease AprX